MRSPAAPRSAISLRSPVAMRRPSGIFPGGKVFQLPPPVVDAKVPTSLAPGWTGCARTGVSTGCASAISGAYGLALGTAAVAFAGRDGAVCGRLVTGFSAIGDCAGAGGGDVDFSATTRGVAEAEG